VNVLTLQVGIVGEEFVDGAAGADLADDHPGRDPHPANAGFAAHDSRVVGDAIELFDGSVPSAWLTLRICLKALWLKAGPSKWMERLERRGVAA